MSLDQFDICSKIETNIKNDIKSFHVFDDIKGFNVLLITNNDLVYGFGQNTFGCCGLGHNNVVNEPQIIPELCHQNIKLFSIGWDFISALNINGNVFVWGYNNWGQIGRGDECEVCLKPNIVSNINNEIIVQVQTGASHSLVLTNEGCIYGWGCNKYGQVGCEYKVGENICFPTKLKSFSKSKIQTIYCDFNHSFALTFDGLVYSWGENSYCQLGHDYQKDKFICEPKIIAIKNVQHISFGGGQKYFLTNEGHIYYCGVFTDNNNCETFEIIPRIINRDIEFNSLHSITSYQTRYSISIAVNSEGIYQIFNNNFMKTKYNSMFEYYAEEHKMSYKTIDNSFEDISQNIFQVNHEYNVLDQLEKISKNIQIKQNIKAFHTIVEIIGMKFILAQDKYNNVYGWGGNTFGELGRGFISKDNIFFKPKEIVFFKNESIIQLSCGSSNSLALTSNGDIYGWGHNEYGQLGCGQKCGKIITTPIEIKTRLKFKSIYCSYGYSFAITIEGLVFSWGYNGYCRLGHEIDMNESIFEPKLIINLSNVINICQSISCTYFLTNDENIYFCGEFSDEYNSVIYQKLPKLLNSEITFDSFISISDYCTRTVLGIALKNEIVYKLYGNRFSKTNYKNSFNYYTKEYKLTHKTVYMNENIWSEKEENSESDNNSLELITPSNNYGIDNNFLVLCELGSGAFGNVFKVQHNLQLKIYALKKISFKDPENNIKLQNEVKVMMNLSVDFVVKYYNSWIDKNSLYIQMELCSDNLKNIIQQKFKYFTRNESKPMNTIEYFISCQLFKELLECVQYLHEKNPPIIHRDLKPENILFSENLSNNRFLKLADFGLAIPLENNTISLSENCGTVRYMAQEVHQGRVSIKSDIYSLSVISQELFDLDINSSDNRITGNDILKSNWKGLEKQFIRMSDIRYKQRPICSDVLSEFKEWGIDNQELKTYEEYHNYKQIDFKNNQDNFFIKYLNAKLNC